MKLILAVFGALLPPTSASAQTTFDNRLDLQYAADLWCSNETAALAEHGSIASWDVSRITEMYCLFSPYCGAGSATGKSTCNPDIGSWDTSAVLYMDNMFWGASSFDKDLSSWDVSAALDMSGMFDDATSLSDCTKARMHASFDAQTSAWPYEYSSWGLLCTGVCGDGTALDPKGFCEVVLGGAAEVVDGKVEVVLDEFTAVVGGKCAVACSDNRRLEEAQEEGAQAAAAAASIVDGLLARHPDFVAELRRANLDEKAIKIMLELGQDFRLPALA